MQLYYIYIYSQQHYKIIPLHPSRGYTQLLTQLSSWNPVDVLSNSSRTGLPTGRAVRKTQWVCPEQVAPAYYDSELGVDSSLLSLCSFAFAVFLHCYFSILQSMTLATQSIPVGTQCAHGCSKVSVWVWTLRPAASTATVAASESRIFIGAIVSGQTIEGFWLTRISPGNTPNCMECIHSKWCHWCRPRTSRLHPLIPQRLPSHKLDKNWLLAWHPGTKTVTVKDSFQQGAPSSNPLPPVPQASDLFGQQPWTYWKVPFASLDYQGTVLKTDMYMTIWCILVYGICLHTWKLQTNHQKAGMES